jgi:hypothetical protein
MKCIIARSNPLSPGKKKHEYRCGNRIAKVYEPAWRIVPEITNVKEKKRFEEDARKEVIFTKLVDIDMSRLKSGERYTLDGFPVWDIPAEIKQMRDIPIKEIKTDMPESGKPKKPGRPPAAEKEKKPEKEKPKNEPEKEFDPLEAIKQKK